MGSCFLLPRTPVLPTLPTPNPPLRAVCAGTFSQRNGSVAHLSSYTFPVTTFDDSVGQPDQSMPLELYNLGCYCGRHDDHNAVTDGFEYSSNTSYFSLQPLSSNSWPNTTCAVTTAACGRFGAAIAQSPAHAG